MVLINSYVSAQDCFYIQVGNEFDQIGFVENNGDMPSRGPVALAVHNRKIYILDEINYRINVYSYQGEFLETVSLPKSFEYFDLHIDNQGNIMVLTDKGIYKLFISEWRHIYDLPQNTTVPYYFSVDINNHVAISVLSQTGRIIIGLIKEDGSFIQLPGYRILSNRSGDTAIQTPDDIIQIYNNGKTSTTVTINGYMIPFGVSDKSIYCLESTNNGLKIAKVYLDGKMQSREISFESDLIYDDTSYIKFFKVDEANKVVYLQGGQKGFQITIIEFN